jgi:hypothetical protein
MRKVILLSLLGLALAPQAHAAETRGYVISWFATATYTENLKEACPEGRNGGIVDMHIRDIQALGYTYAEAKAAMDSTRDPENMPRELGDRNRNRAIVNGKNVSIYSYPDATPDPNIETIVGEYAYGFDLGGKNQAAKFTDPETRQKVDNQLWRAVGCEHSFKVAPPLMPYPEEVAWNIFIDSAPAWTMQITGEDLSKDGPITITLDRATQHLERDAAAYVLTGATYILEPTRRSHNVIKGEIKNGEITITPQDIYLEGEMPHYSEIDIKNTHMRFKLQPDGRLIGYWGGYIDWKRYIYMFMTRPGNDADHIGLYWALKKMADAEPDPLTGQNRLISTTFRVQAVPAFLTDINGKVLAVPQGTEEGLN